MSASLKNQQGFSLPDVMVAMVLMVMIVTALSGIQRTLMNSLAAETSTNSSGGMVGSKRNCARFRHLPTGRSTECRHRRRDVSASALR
ncbi:prepilin peptidase-dependent protein C [Escherichia coli]|uniref:Prepilin peptidase-dependent protein C n=1 Tax=Escherichia coli TaxID=562 RepID=A0A376KNL1_ECOLX|nr:prepilin peptidase-dependent protein C [Escherichia coli]